MLKKYSMGMALFLTLLPIVHASPYLGFSTGVAVNTSDNIKTLDETAANYRGMPLTIMGGYGANLNNAFYVGGELFVTPFTGELNSSSGNYLKTTYGYGLSFIPGINLGELTLAYARLGIVRTHYDSEDTTVNGAQFGLGLQTSFTQHWDLRGEYNVTTYNNFNVVSSPKSDQFNLGIVYRF